MERSISIKQILEEYDSVLQTYTIAVEKRFSRENLFEYNEILFSAHSCAIEGNSFSVNDTKELKEHGLKLKLHDKSMLEAFEILDHFNAYEFLFADLTVPFSEDLLISTHKILTKNTIHYTKGYDPGAYTTTQMAAGDTIFPDHEISIAQIPDLMEQTQEAINRKSIHPIEIAAKFHKYLIYLHPFPDGNGRLGRLLSNFILSKFHHPIVIVQAEQKQDYVDALKMSHKHNDLDIITGFFARTSINRMNDELAQIKMNTMSAQEGNEKKHTPGLSFIF
ncbi:MAG: Fic family protein [Niabella sp.]